MKSKSIRIVLAISLLMLALNAVAHDPLPSWTDGDTKSAIIEFVQSVSTQGSSDFVPVAERIATFDNDGCLWSEQPMYFQVLYAFDYIRENAGDHPEWADTEPFKSVIAGDMAGVMASGMKGLGTIIAASHVNLTAEEFSASVGQWLATAKNSETNMLYTQMIYQPMLELLDYLRANDFKTYIVSGGGIDFIRVFAEEAYGIPPEQVVGSTLDASYELRDGIPTITKEPKLLLNDDKAGKPVGIYRHIGRRPIFAGGNSDGDLKMLEYTTIARSSDDNRPSFGLLVHHTDAEREFAYDREGHIGVLNKGLDEAPQRGWHIVDMKNDWLTIYPETD